ncbi:uncharacterized protein K444DRAFT_631185 [Hyaloscypha bicolor E]|uniref:Uncharacterized protein n=1 Tax=Hyaloscypha bicolor E TaxID=1095630 RepID=A0A2J6T527_9HELO|nr:uncharacterized protein K444DRAFT_631185 [Hyaloscypha bicolor E]PMD58129.1 hypothetical protein K444DRAFT_631185 [Hyaloscypha bicolor E]
MTCGIMAATAPYVPEMEGTTDLATSIYHEVGGNILAGPEVPYSPSQVEGFGAPIAPMFSSPNMPVLKLDTNMMFISNFWYPAFEITAGHHHYSEQLALDLEDHSGMFAEPRYSDKYALSPIEEEACYDYVEELALSPVYKKPRKLLRRGRKQSRAKDIDESGHGYAEELELSTACKERRKLPHRGRKKTVASMTDVADCIIVAVPEEMQQNASWEARPQAKNEKPEDSPTEKPASGRKRKHMVDQGERPVRKSKRSRKVICYAE